MAYDANYPADNLIIAQGPAAIRQKGEDLKLLIDNVEGKKLDKANNVSTYGYHYRDVSGYSTPSGSGANTTGTLKITLPTSWLNTTLKIKVEGFNSVSGGGNWSAELQGYNATTSVWVNTSAILSPNCPFTSVRFGHDGTKCCILLGTTSTVWQYPQITISDVYASYSNVNQYATGWALSFITNETGITMSSTPNVKTLVDATRTDVFAPAGYGLGGRSVILSSGNLNTVYDIGFYYVDGNCTNQPIAGGGFYLIVHGSLYSGTTPAHFSQIATYHSTGVTYTRNCYNGTWSAWKQLLRKGDYGLGSTSTPLSSVNLNTVYDIGFYYVGGNCTNQPIAGSGFYLIVQGSLYSGTTPAHFSQIATKHDTGVTYTRTCYNGTWSAWQQLITDTDFTQLLSANGVAYPENFIASGRKVSNVNANQITIGAGKNVVNGKPIPFNANTLTVPARSTNLIADKEDGTTVLVPAQYPTNMIDNNTVGFWIFNKTAAGANVPNSAVGLSSIAVANDLVPTGGITSVDGWCDYASKGDGTSGKYTSQNGTGIPIGATTREINMLITEQASTSWLLYYGTGTSAVSLEIVGARVRFNTGGSAYDTGYDLTNGKVSLLTISYDGTVFRLKINGSLIYTLSLALATTTSVLQLLNLNSNYFCGVTLHYLEIRNALRTDEQTAQIANKLLLPCFYTDTNGTRKSITEILPANSVSLGMVKANSTGVTAYNDTDYMYGRREGAYGGNRRVFLGWKAVTTSSGAVYYDNVLGTENINYTVFYKKNITDTTIAKIDWYQNSSGQNFGVIMNNNQAKIKVTVAANGIVPTYNSPTGNGEISGYIGVYAEVLE